MVNLLGQLGSPSERQWGVSSWCWAVYHNQFTLDTLSTIRYLSQGEGLCLIELCILYPGSGNPFRSCFLNRGKDGRVGARTFTLMMSGLYCTASPHSCIRSAVGSSRYARAVTCSLAPPRTRTTKSSTMLSFLFLSGMDTEPWHVRGSIFTPWNLLQPTWQPGNYNVQGGLPGDVSGTIHISASKGVTV